MSGQHPEFKSAGAEVLAVVSAGLDQARHHVQELKLPFPCLVDTEHATYDLYQVESDVLSMGQQPGLYVIDREGVVRYAHVGWQQWEIPSNAEILAVCRQIALSQ